MPLQAILLFQILALLAFAEFISAKNLFKKQHKGRLRIISILPALEHLLSDLISWEFARPALWKKSSLIPSFPMGYSADTAHGQPLHIVVTFRIFPLYTTLL